MFKLQPPFLYLHFSPPPILILLCFGHTQILVKLIGEKYEHYLLLLTINFILSNQIFLRFRDEPNSLDATTKRYVITAPPGHFPLLPSDQVFMLLQFDPGTEYRPDWGEQGQNAIAHLVSRIH